jgi:hypothetical protein
VPDRGQRRTVAAAPLLLIVLAGLTFEDGLMFLVFFNSRRDHD